MKTKLFLLSGIVMVAGAAHATQGVWDGNKVNYGSGLSMAVENGDHANFSNKVSNADLINGKIGTPLTGDAGWHPVNTNPADQWAAFTDGVLGGGLAGLLNDPIDSMLMGTAIKRVQYNLDGPTDVAAVRVFTGNDGRDGRVFHAYYSEWSTDGSTWNFGYYAQSHNTGHINNSSVNNWKDVSTTVSRAGGTLWEDAVAVRFYFFAVHNTVNENRDYINGVNPFTGVDDGFSAAQVSPLVREIDIEAVPEPGTMIALGAGLAALAARRRRK